jgi:hypothetical protein
MNPEMRSMLLKLDGVYEPKPSASGESQAAEPHQQEQAS